MKIILFGPQGSGKGTQANLLTEELDLNHISPGELFRAEVKKGTDLGKKMKDYMDKGHLVPKEINFEVVKQALAKTNFEKYILDGFPRNQEQVEYLETITHPEFAIEIKINDTESVKRISARYECSKCKKGYNTICLKPKKEGVCDVCGGELIQRDDDHADAIQKRLKLYHEHTVPIFNFYKKKGIFHEINGEQSIEDVFKDLKKILVSK